MRTTDKYGSYKHASYSFKSSTTADDIEYVLVKDKIARLKITSIYKHPNGYVSNFNTVKTTQAYSRKAIKKKASTISVKEGDQKGKKITRYSYTNQGATKHAGTTEHNRVTSQTLASTYTYKSTKTRTEHPTAYTTSTLGKTRGSYSKGGKGVYTGSVTTSAYGGKAWIPSSKTFQPALNLTTINTTMEATDTFLNGSVRSTKTKPILVQTTETTDQVYTILYSTRSNHSKIYGITTSNYNTKAVTAKHAEAEFQEILATAHRFVTNNKLADIDNDFVFKGYKKVTLSQKFVQPSYIKTYGASTYDEVTSDTVENGDLETGVTHKGIRASKGTTDASRTTYFTVSTSTSTIYSETSTDNYYWAGSVKGYELANVVSTTSSTQTAYDWNRVTTSQKAQTTIWTRDSLGHNGGESVITGMTPSVMSLRNYTSFYTTGGTSVITLYKDLITTAKGKSASSEGTVFGRDYAGYSAKTIRKFLRTKNKGVQTGVEGRIGFQEQEYTTWTTAKDKGGTYNRGNVLKRQVETVIMDGKRDLVTDNTSTWNDVYFIDKEGERLTVQGLCVKCGGTFNDDPERLTKWVGVKPRQSRVIQVRVRQESPMDSPVGGKTIYGGFLGRDVNVCRSYEVYDCPWGTYSKGMFSYEQGRSATAMGKESFEERSEYFVDKPVYIIEPETSQKTLTVTDTVWVKGQSAKIRQYVELPRGGLFVTSPTDSIGSIFTYESTQNWLPINNIGKNIFNHYVIQKNTAQSNYSASSTFEVDYTKTFSTKSSTFTTTVENIKTTTASSETSTYPRIENIDRTNTYMTFSTRTLSETLYIGDTATTTDYIEISRTLPIFTRGSAAEFDEYAEQYISARRGQPSFGQQIDPQLDTICSFTKNYLSVTYTNSYTTEETTLGFSRDEYETSENNDFVNKVYNVVSTITGSSIAQSFSIEESSHLSVELETYDNLTTYNVMQGLRGFSVIGAKHYDGTPATASLFNDNHFVDLTMYSVVSSRRGDESWKSFAIPKNSHVSFELQNNIATLLKRDSYYTKAEYANNLNTDFADKYIYVKKISTGLKNQIVYGFNKTHAQVFYSDIPTNTEHADFSNIWEDGMRMHTSVFHLHKNTNDEEITFLKPDIYIEKIKNDKSLDYY